jgi:Ca2+-transporting ATPase
MPIVPIQILFIDLGTDVLPSMALAVDDGDNDIMSQKPRNAKEKLLNKNVISYLLQVGILGASLGLINFFIVMTQNGGISETSLYYSRATTVVYSTLVICQIVNSFMCRNNNGNFYEIVFGNRKLLISVMISITLLFNVVYNPFFQNIFSTSDLLLSDWALVMFSGIIFLFFLLIRLKYFLNRSMVFKKI